MAEIADNITLKWKNKLTAWQTFIASVQSGYVLTIYDYTNDLSVRDALEELRTQAAVPQEQIKRLDEADTTFKAATADYGKPLTHKPDGKEPGWWWYRVPITLEGELKADLDSL